MSEIEFDRVKLLEERIFRQALAVADQAGFDRGWWVGWTQAECFQPITAPQLPQRRVMTGSRATAQARPRAKGWFRTPRPPATS